MNPHRHELADVIKRFGKKYTDTYHPNAYHKRVLQTITQCRTSELGGHIQECDSCGEKRISYNSCRNRHCPKCQSSKQALWVDTLLQTTLPIKHYHIVFTIPHELMSCVYSIVQHSTTIFYQCVGYIAYLGILSFWC